LVAYLQKEVAALRPKKVMCIGTSAAGYAAIAAGHQLGADYVHAFAPQTLLDTSFAAIRSSRYKRSRWRLRLSRRARPELFDLAPLLRQPNGRTRYFLHYGAGSTRDSEHARRLSGLPGVVLIGYPCAAHAIGIFLARRDFLKQTLDFESQEDLTERAKAHFDDGIRIDEENVAATAVL